VDLISSEIAGHYQKKALKYLERINAPSERKIFLTEFTRDMMRREK
jgi:geranylgeranyl pyrophosphate synthase